MSTRRLKVGLQSRMSIAMLISDSLISGAALAANNLIQLYDGYRSGGTTGMFVAPVYWWEAGAAWNVC
jgi:mannan endo-1,6-alpha-mannosidase